VTAKMMKTGIIILISITYISAQPASEVRPNTYALIGTPTFINTGPGSLEDSSMAGIQQRKSLPVPSSMQKEIFEAITTFMKATRIIPNLQQYEGNRKVLYSILEDILEKNGVGKGWLLQFICNIHSNPPVHPSETAMDVFELMTPSKSPYDEELQDYVIAEAAGELHLDCEQLYNAFL
ncbi:hypothetical protein L9F63_020559, partial [Diploptera punctata]